MAKRTSAVHATIRVIGATELSTSERGSALADVTGDRARFLEWVVALREDEHYKSVVLGNGHTGRKRLLAGDVAERLTAARAEFGDDELASTPVTNDHVFKMANILKNNSKFLLGGTAGYCVVDNSPTVRVDVLLFLEAAHHGAQKAGGAVMPREYAAAANQWPIAKHRPYLSWPDEADDIMGIVPDVVHASRKRLMKLRAKLDEDYPRAALPETVQLGAPEQSSAAKMNSAAWHVLVQLDTRITGSPLEGNGVLREALTSLHAFFGEIRKAMIDAGPEIAQPVGESLYDDSLLALRRIRGLLAHWHPLLSEREREVNAVGRLAEDDWPRSDELRSDIERLRVDLVDFRARLARYAGID